jgi:ubiquitin-activating enzyme E1
MSDELNTSMEGKVDEDLYSRVMYALGKDTLVKLSKSIVLIIGCDGLGVEIAKNMVLSGLSVDLLDKTIVDEIDVKSNIYITSDKIGLHRDLSIKEHIRELNNYASVKVVDKINIHENKYTAMILANQSVEYGIYINQYCRKNNIPFVFAQSRGMFGQVINDFGSEFIVNDVNGEDAKSGYIKNINTMCIETIENHGLQCDDEVKLVYEDGETEIFQIKLLNNKSFISKIDTLNYDELKLKRNIKFVQIKRPVKIIHRSFMELIKHPEFMITNLSHFNHPQIIHKLLINYDIVKDLCKTYDEAYSYYKHIFDEIECDDSYIKKFIKSCNSECVAVHSIIGGIASQEITKACVNKLMPLNEIFTYGSCSFNIISEDYEKETLFEKKERKEMWGDDFELKLNNSKGFIVGSGAIGSEHLKNFGMCGIGNIIITDPDKIEKSNLSRQFLFRNHDIGTFKSETAGKVIKKMIPLLNIETHTNTVSNESTSIYHRKFYENLTFIANAVDNIKARKFIDDECLMYKKPLFESGTLGTKGNTQTVIPDMTLTYNSTTDPPEEDIPLCTLKSFPYKTEHTISWARDKFSEYFENMPSNFVKYIEDEKFISSMQYGEQMSVALAMNEFLKNIPPPESFTFEDCVKHAIDTWIKDFRDFTIDLLRQYPPDSDSTETPFWIGNKKCPLVPVFDIKNPLIFDYVFSYANLMAYIFNIEQSSDHEKIIKIVNSYEIKPYENRKNTIGINEEEEKKLHEEKMKSYTLEELMPSRENISKYSFRSHVFEKDDSTNYHIDFITACSNNRAFIYGIEQLDKLETKRIAGKIIPALATTTAIVSGLITIEILKYIKGCDKIEDYTDTFLNIAIPIFIQSEPRPANIINYKGFKYTLWDRFDIHGNPTPLEIIEILKNIIKLNVNTICNGSTIVYSSDESSMSIKKQNKVKDIKIFDLIQSSDNIIMLDYDIENDDEDDDVFENNILLPPLYIHKNT